MPRKEIVTKVYDGDTFLTNCRKHPVRLADVDTPEKRQPGYDKAKRALEKLVLGEAVVVNAVARDTYDRCVAKVKVGNKSVNNTMKKYKK